MDLKAVFPFIAQGSLILLVLSVALQAHWRDLTVVLRRPALLVRGFVAVNLVVPGVAFVMVALLPLEPAVKVGIMAMAVSPLAPLVPGKMLQAGSDTSYAIGLFVALILLAVVVVPLTFVILGSFYPHAGSVSLIDLARLVLTSVLVPVLVGLAVGSTFPALARRLSPIAKTAGNVALLIIFVAILAKAGKPMMALIGDGGLFATFVPIVAGLAAGHWLGGPEPANRMAMALAAATRHPGIAGLIVHHSFDDPRAMLAVLLFLLNSVVISTAYQAWQKRRLSPSDGGGTDAADQRDDLAK